MLPMNSKIFLEAVNASKGSDIYGIRNILEQKILNSFDEEKKFGEWGPCEYALHILCCFMTNIYGGQKETGESYFRKSLDGTLKKIAYERYEKRRKLNIEGSAQTDWENSLCDFADACLIYWNYEGDSSRKERAA